MLIIVLILLALLLGAIGWCAYANFKRPYLVATTNLKKPQLQYKLQHQANQTITAKTPKRKWFYYLSMASIVIGLICLLVSCYLLETKLDLLIMPTKAVISSIILLVISVVLFMIYPLVWPSQSYDYWIIKKTNDQPFTLADTRTFKKYRLRQIWGTLALDLFIIVAWVSRAVSISTEPVYVIEFLIIVAVLAIPVVTLVSALAQLVYLQHDHYLKPRRGQSKFGTLNYRAVQALLKQQPDLKRKVLTAHIARLIGYLFGLYAFWILYSNIVAPAFSTDTAAVFPAAIMALIALVILETVGAIWPQHNYDYMQLLDTTKLPFTINGSDQFTKFKAHLYYYHLSAGIVWLTIWLAIVGAYYYFG